MKLVLQRVDRARARILGEPETASGWRIDRGLVVSVAFLRGDTEATALRAASKVAHVRIIEDGDSWFGRSVVDDGGQVLVLFQLPVAADLSRGRKPNFSGALPPEPARALYATFVRSLKDEGLDVIAGPFQQRMTLETTGRGPFILPFEVH